MGRSISVIVPVYNGEKFINAALSSVENQTYPVDEWIFVNDGSTDATLSKLAAIQHQNPRITVISTEHRGLSQARNAGIGAARTDWVAFLDIDDQWSPDKVRNQMLHILAHKECVIAFSNAETFDSDSKRTVITSGSENRSAINILSGNARISGSASSIVVRRDVLIQAGGFDETFSFGEDLELWVRLASNYNICRVNSFDVQIFRNIGGMQLGTSGIQNYFRHNELIMAIVSKNFNHLDIYKYRSSIYLAFWGDSWRNLSSGPYCFSQLHMCLKSQFPDLTSILFSTKYKLWQSFFFAQIIKLLRRWRSRNE